MRAAALLLLVTACSSSKRAPDAAPRPAVVKVDAAAIALDATSLTYAYELTPTAELVGDARVSVSAACQLGGPAATDADEPDVTLHPGEAAHVAGALFEGGALTLRPRQCELTLYLRRAGGGSTEVARHCLLDGAVTAGPC